MRTVVEPTTTWHSPDSLAAALRGQPGLVLLRSGSFDVPSARYSIVTCRPEITFRSWGSDCEIRSAEGTRSTHFGDPWRHLAVLLAPFELPDEADVPFPLGGCFGFWGYDLKQFVEPRVPRRAINDLELPDCHLGFHTSLVVFDHQQQSTWIVATGLDASGTRSDRRIREQIGWWRERLAEAPAVPRTLPEEIPSGPLGSSMAREAFLRAVRRAQDYIRSGDIYQVNLAQRLHTRLGSSPWGFFERLTARSPAPFSAFLDCEGFQLLSTSPELFLRLSGNHITTRPIKGTRPRDPDPVRDTQLGWELQRSEKENAELLMITDLLRNDLGRICDYGSVRVPDLMRLERFAQVQHLVSTVEGDLRADLTHLEALRSCFPGGSITGAPKIRAMEIIDELEPVSRGPYCGAHGYLGFNRESQLSITIRTAVVRDDTAWFHVGAGIVADSDPEAEHQETLAKAAGFVAALQGAGRNGTAERTPETAGRPVG